MSDNKKYYYLKLKDNFFDSDEIKILEAMPNGISYSNLLLKLYLKSLKCNGALVFNDYIPYNVDMIAAITNLNIDTVRSGLEILSRMNLIDKLDDGTIYMTNIQNFIGKSTTEADRKREYRKTIEDKKLLSSKSRTNVLTNVGEMSDERTPENRDKRLENRDKRLDINTISKDIVSSNKLLPIIEKWNSLNLAKIISIKPSTKRYTMLNARIKEYGVDKILEAIESITKSDFLKGQNNKNWIITFDWFIKPNNFTKVLEGNYDNREVNTNAKHSRTDTKKSKSIYDDFLKSL